MNNKLNNIALTPTDFPEPVVPATSKCGIFARSTTTDLPAISCPSASVKLEVEVLKAFDERISVSLTIFLLVLGISIPTTDLPSITSTTLTELTDNDLAISWAMFVILLALVPGAGCISKRVTTGPGRTVSTEASIPNSSSFVSSNRANSFNSASDKDDPSSRALSSNWVLGIFVFFSTVLTWSWVGASTSFNFVSVLISCCFEGIGSCLLLSNRIFLDFGSFLVLTFLAALVSLSEFTKFFR